MSLDSALLLRISQGQSKIPNTRDNLAEIYGLRQSVFNAFEEFCQGMAYSCMTQLATHRLLLRYLTHSVLTTIHEHQEQYELDCIGSCLMFLLSLVQDNPDSHQELSTLLHELNLNHLMHLMTMVYSLFHS